MKYPASLLPGDTICILSPAGKIDPELIERAASVLTRWGLRPQISAYAADSHGRFASLRENRLHDFQNALLNPEVKAIFCSRGGYGAVQLLEDIAPEMIRNNPKWLVGYSDITLLHAAFSRSEIISLHAPMAKQLAEHPDDEISGLIKAVLFGGRPKYRVSSHELNRCGTASGRVVGGNLSVLSGLRGTPYDYSYDGAILFLEDIAEPLYKIDRMLYNLRLGGVFDRISGLVVGQFSDCPEDLSMEGTLYERIREMVKSYHFPVCFDFPCGHVDFNVPLPVGANATFEVTDKEAALCFLE
ncbi:MAG: LD-carboxypeptidase [Bacteroidales bacterium]